MSGTQRVVLRGNVDGRSKIIWKGKGDGLPDVPAGSLPLPGGGFPVLVQGDTGVCFETSFGSGDVVENLADRLKLQPQPSEAA